MFIFEKREHMHTNMQVGKGRQMGRLRIQSGFHADSRDPDVGLELTNHEIMTWAKIKSQTPNQLSHPGAPNTCGSLKALYEI